LRRTRVPATAVLAATLAALAIAATAMAAPAMTAAAAAAALDGSSRDRSAATAPDRFVARAYLPSPQRVHGELRLIRRGDLLVMQTLLYSDSLRRGVDRIRKKELYHWPAGRPGAGDSARYLAGLEQAKRHVLERFAAPTRPADPRPRLLVEFVLGAGDAEVGFYDVEVERGADGFTVRDRQPILVLDSSVEYVGRAIRIQGEEGFDAPVAELSALPR
jgi:hypothetical protein